MTFKDLDINISYISHGEDNIAKSLINPCLHLCRFYKRSVGFFSSSVLNIILSGIMSFVNNGEKIQLITSTQLSQDDIDAINAGYASRDSILEKSYSSSFVSELEQLEDDKLFLLSQLISSNLLDIKIAITKSNGIYHDKFGILEDYSGNKVVFFGSANSSQSGYQENYEKVRVVKSWIPGNIENVNDEVLEFNSLWNNSNEYIDVLPFKKCIEENVLRVVENRKSRKSKGPGIVLRSYQKEAVDAWVNNDYHGFFVMATGTGKTWTAIFSASELIKTHPSLITIIAPYKHLVKQWAEDVKRMMPKAKIILVSSENPTWPSEISQAIVRQKIDKQYQIVIISTIVSFELEKFKTVIKKSTQDKLLIVDEAHNFTKRDESLKETYKYMLGLSATPYSGKDSSSGNALMDFFGGRIYNLPIEKALEDGHLVPYNYYPIIIGATEDEESRFNHYSVVMASCFKNGKCIDPDKLFKAKGNRLRVISMAQEKLDKIDNILSSIKEKSHLIVYCGDGKIFFSEEDSIKHINFVKEHLSKAGYKPSQFTAKENMKERMDLVETFDSGAITALAAIKCLDEGINIPSIEGALILSSNDSYREFAQRRGRILRKHKGKKSANIYDVIVLPTTDCPKMAEIELRRLFEYGRLAQNKSEIMKLLDEQLNWYGLTYEDIEFKYDDNTEGVIDD